MWQYVGEISVGWTYHIDISDEDISHNYLKLKALDILRYLNLTCKYNITSEPIWKIRKDKFKFG